MWDGYLTWAPSAAPNFSLASSSVRGGRVCVHAAVSAAATLRGHLVDAPEMFRE